MVIQCKVSEKKPRNSVYQLNNAWGADTRYENQSAFRLEGSFSNRSDDAATAFIKILTQNIINRFQRDILFNGARFHSVFCGVIFERE